MPPLIRPVTSTPPPTRLAASCGLIGSASRPPSLEQVCLGLPLQRRGWSSNCRGRSTPAHFCLGSNVKLGPNSAVKVETSYPERWLQLSDGAHVEMSFDQMSSIGDRRDGHRRARGHGLSPRRWDAEQERWLPVDATVSSAKEVDG